MVTEMSQDDGAGRGAAHVLASALALSTLLCAGCMFVPARYKLPQREYPPSVEQVSVFGFQYDHFVQTGGSSGYVAGQHVFGASNAWQGEYHQASDAPFFQHALENTRCVRTVDEGGGADLQLLGDEAWNVYHGAYVIAGWLETLTLLPIVGVPYVENADGGAVARLYRDGEYVREYRTSSHLLYLTTLFTFENDRATAAGRVRGMALRDLADQVAADLCRE